jgi:hypothetical protein
VPILVDFYARGDAGAPWVLVLYQRPHAKIGCASLSPEFHWGALVDVTEGFAEVDRVAHLQSFGDIGERIVAFLQELRGLLHLQFELEAGRGGFELVFPLTIKGPSGEAIVGGQPFKVDLPATMQLNERGDLLELGFDFRRGLMACLRGNCPKRKDC